MIEHLLILILMFLITNILWEFSHAILYDWTKPPIKGKYFKRLSISIIGDVIILSIIFLLISIIKQNLIWIINPQTIDFVFIAIFGIITAIFIELRALSEKRWSYRKTMPTIFNIGVTPLIQLAITGIASLYLTKLILN